MSLWAWFRGRPGWLRWGLLPPAALAGVVLLYVAGRSLQYLGAEKDPGLFVPSRANVAFRVRALGAHWGRIRGTAAWRAIDRRILRDRALRAGIDGILREAGLPALDDWEDVRRGDPAGFFFRVAGEDAVLAMRVGDTWARAPWCAAARLRWRDFLLVPLAAWFLPSEKVSGHSCLKVRRGGGDLLVSFQGAVAVAGRDRAFLEEALRAPGAREAPERPLAWRIEFQGSRALESLRQRLGEAGLFAFLRAEPARGMRGTADVVGSEVRVEVFLEGASPAGPDPPAGLAGLAPVYASGFLLGRAGAWDLFQWLKRQAASSKDLQEVVRALEEAGVSSGVLSRLGSGMAAIFGSDEREGRLYPAVALVFPSSDPRGAVEAMNAAIRSPRLAGKQAEARLERRPAGEGEMVFWRWPEGVMLGPVRFNDILQLSYAALRDAVVLGNSAGFTEAVVERAAGRGEGLLGRGFCRRALERAGAAGRPAVLLSPPLFRESMDGLLGGWAALEVYSEKDGARRRAEIEEDLRRQGRSASQEEIVRLFNEAVERSKRDREDALRRSLRALDAVEWAEVRVEPSGEGVGIRLSVAFR